MIPGSRNEAALLQAAQQRINRIGIDREQIAAEADDSLHQAVTVIGMLLDEMQQQRGKEGLTLDRTADDLVDAMAIRHSDGRMHDRLVAVGALDFSSVALLDRPAA